MPSNRRVTRSYSKKTASAVKLQRFIRRKKSAKAQAIQLAKTNKRIDSILSRERQGIQRWGMRTRGFKTTLTTVEVIPLCPANTAGTTGFPAWDNVFADSANAFEASKIRLGKLHLDMQMTCYSELNPVNFTVAIVKLRPDNAENIVSSLGDDLNGITVNTDYIEGVNPLSGSGQANTAGFVMLNPDRYIVKKQWQFTLGAIENTTSGSSRAYSAIKGGMEGTTKNMKYSVPLNYTIGKGTGKWSDQSASQDTEPRLRNYLLVFTNNYSVDAEYPSFGYNAYCSASYNP